MADRYPQRPASFVGPGMPGARMDPPEMAVVRAARHRFEAAKRELVIKANTAARYWKAWEDRRDPALKRTAETEVMLSLRVAESLVKPAARAYARAIFRAIDAGCTTAGGSFSHEEALRRLLDLDAIGIQFGDEFLLPRQQWAVALDRVAHQALRLCAQKDERGLKLAIMCHTLAGALDLHPAWMSGVEAVFESSYKAWIEGGAKD